jgi:hypothetical protein
LKLGLAAGWLVVVVAVISVGLAGRLPHHGNGLDTGSRDYEPVPDAAVVHQRPLPGENTPGLVTLGDDRQPLSYGLAALRQGLYWERDGGAASVENNLFGVSVVFAVAMFVAACAGAARPEICSERTWLLRGLIVSPCCWPVVWMHMPTESPRPTAVGRPVPRFADGSQRPAIALDDPGQVWVAAFIFTPLRRSARDDIR